MFWKQFYPSCGVLVPQTPLLQMPLDKLTQMTLSMYLIFDIKYPAYWVMKSETCNKDRQNTTGSKNSLLLKTAKQSISHFYYQTLHKLYATDTASIIHCGREL